MLYPSRIAFIAIGFFLAHCKSNPVLEGDPQLFSGEARAYSSKEAITICFKQTSAASGWKDVDQLNQAFKDAIEEEWGAKAGLKTDGWKPCSQMPNAMVHLNFFDCSIDAPDCPDQNHRPHVAFIGPPPSGQPNVVNLRRAWTGHWREKECNGKKGINGEKAKSELESRKECTRNYGLHEFGHILGFMHEHTHADVPGPACEHDNEEHYAKAGVGAAKWTCSAGYDEDSVMNYCSKGWFNWNRGLSAKDVICAKEFFARQP